MKYLSGLELAGFIKQRQASEVAALWRQSVVPGLAIVMAVDNPVINTYVNLKSAYGADIGVKVGINKVKQTDIEELLNKLSKDDSIHGIIVQLPLEDPSQTDRIVNLVPAAKDVDGLGRGAKFEPATPLAIQWLLAGYNINLAGKKILLIGRGRLVGAPLEQIFKASGLEPMVADKTTDNLKELSLQADLIITATGQASILKADMIKEGAIVIDGGVASEEGQIVGDIDPAVYETRDDLTITPQKGGVGPLTVCALFENVIRSARRT